MTDIKASIGAIVRATAGRDEDGLFIIINVIDHEYVLIANGENRTIKKPKKKKLKHLKFLGFVDENIATLVSTKRLQDADIRKSIKSFE
ncbi:MAG: RNA-binding protein [Clostridia bacterium]|nr:RNA-binding protein [Clostridia bacterium]